MYRNARQALVGELKYLLEHGIERDSRNGSVLETTARLISIERPSERFLILPHRNDNPFAKVFESLWVLAGRDDIQSLSHYLPRAADYSDDGKVWRGAYGPRLRNWKRYGTSPVDQIEECYQLLKADPDTRRAVMTIFDPSQDFCASKDIPCNNWLQFLLRDGKLDLHVTTRSNDVIWGFSGINTFEWSILQQVMATMLCVDVGAYHQFTGSLHLYEKHWGNARAIIAGYNGFEPYDFIKPAVDGYPVTAMQLNRFMWYELKAREELVDPAQDLFGTGFLQDAIVMCRIWSALKIKQYDTARELWATMPVSDAKLAVHNYFIKNNGEYLPANGLLTSIYAQHVEVDYHLTRLDVVDLLDELERKKTLIYGQSWRKHGEVLSIFANISRKYDRIEQLEAGATETVGEALVDAYGDLAVYCLKYAGFLGETYNQRGCAISFTTALSDVTSKIWHTGALDYQYHELESILTSTMAYSWMIEKYNHTMEMASLSISKIEALSKSNPAQVKKWVEYIHSL